MSENKNQKPTKEQIEKIEKKRAGVIKKKKAIISKLYNRMIVDLGRIEKMAKKLDVNDMDKLDFTFSQLSEKVERIRTGFKTKEDDEEEIVDIFQ